MMEVVEHAGKIYPKFQTNGNAARFAMPFAKEVLSGKGLDIGCNRAEWAYPGAKMIDLEIDDEWHAFNLPDEEYNYIFSSHCLEHIPDWVGALNYWGEHLKPGGVMFLYLPHYSQTYWRPWSNRKHVNILTPEFINDYFEDRGYHNILVSGADLYNAFYGVACK
jgi:SAM-dependent methyltransferase